MAVLIYFFTALAAVYLCLLAVSEYRIVGSIFGEGTGKTKTNNSEADSGAENSLITQNEENPLVIAHRGGAGLKPENTMTAFQNAARLGVDIIELDVRLSADEELVVHHDARIDRTSDGSGRIEDMKLDDLREFDFSYDFERETPQQIPLLSDVLEEFPDTILIVEIKDKEETGKRAAEVLADLVNSSEAGERVIAGSFQDEVLTHYHRVLSDRVHRSAARVEFAVFFILTLLKLEGLFWRDFSAVQIPTNFKGIDLRRKTFIERANRYGAAVHYWTVNDPGEMMHLKKLKADGIITDRPDILLDIYEKEID
ncbi:glycerophosphodiester phosphodiesterase [Halarsenatibacter silvermanii]|uniref:Glycerophosphoryl diester phosphodiesterase n=1 Tax=Halarsenatibacter silvermanii TaxID=321763 RepID=A0A1G9KPA9_9FIRM|nr:glycerophosphodiester phosphodiesterase [Halarsenatibacter silvermanii]SDL51215.1 glycerophosphoryl diester phosphodiesterase [Halarsenatibacter silvermanii]